MKAKHDITVPVRSVGTDTFWVLHTHCEKASLLFTGIPALLLLSFLLLLCAIVVIVMLVAVAAIVVVMIRAVVIIAKIIGGLP